MSNFCVSTLSLSSFVLSTKKKVAKSNLISGDFCKECECNGNINVTDPEACDRVTGLCQKCLFDTFGDDCGRCAPWFYGDAKVLKNCQGVYFTI